MVEPTLSNWHRHQTTHVPLPQLPSRRKLLDHSANAIYGVFSNRDKSHETPSSPQGDPDAMWRYVLPFLVKHKGQPPKLSWVPELIGLPRVRDLVWNTIWTDTNPFLDSLDKDVSAMIVYLTGEVASSPCTRCAQGRGPFKGCILISKAAAENARNAITGCANCLYHQCQTYCSHKTITKAAVASVPSPFTVTPSKGTKENEMVMSSWLPTLPSSPDETSHNFSFADWTPEMRRNAPRPIYEPSEVHVKEMASEQRSYKMLLGEHLALPHKLAITNSTFSSQWKPCQHQRRNYP